MGECDVTMNVIGRYMYNIGSFIHSRPLRKYLHVKKELVGFSLVVFLSNHQI